MCRLSLPTFGQTKSQNTRALRGCCSSMKGKSSSFIHSKFIQVVSPLLVFCWSRWRPSRTFPSGLVALTGNCTPELFLVGFLRIRIKPAHLMRGTATENRWPPLHPSCWLGPYLLNSLSCRLHRFFSPFLGTNTSGGILQYFPHAM